MPMSITAIAASLLVTLGAAAPTDPATESAVKFGNVQLSTGVRLRYAVKGDVSGTPVILLHGYSDSWFSFSRIMPSIPASYRVYALDQRGHGESERPRTGYSMKELGADVVAFMDAMQIERAIVIGHSMGGFVAQEVVAAAPDRVAGLVLVNTGTTIKTMNGLDDFRAAVSALTDPVSQVFVREFQYSTVHQQVPVDFMDRAILESLKLPAYVWHGILAGMFEAELPNRIGTSTMPALIIWGEEDAVLPLAARDALVTSMAGPVELKNYAETGHAPHWERPQQFAQDLNEFLAKLR